MAVAACAGVVLWPAAALAHGDVLLVDRQVEVGPEGEALATAGVHYHRLVATARADAPVLLELVDDHSGEVVVSVGPAATLEVNRLVRCCRDVGWTDHTLVVRNPGPATATVDVRARLVHDDLAVMVDGAEPGARSSVVLLGVGWAVLLWRAVRHRSDAMPLARAVVPLAAVVGGVLALTAWGRWRYGSGGPTGLLAGLADLAPVPSNPLVSGATLLLAVVLVGWAWAGVVWARADGPGSRAWWVTGVVLVAAPVLAAVLVSVAYGGAGIAAGAGLLAVAPVLAVLPVRVSGARVPSP